MDMKMIPKVCIFTIICIYLATNEGSAKRLQNLLCQSRPAVVPTDPLFYPYFVSLHRCNGSWGTHSPARFRCVPSAEENILVPVQFGREEKIVILKNHTKCKTECVVKKEDCPYPNRYDPVSCRCICNHATAPKDIQCGPLKSWSKVKCGCVCNKMNRSCSNRKYYFDEKTCSCQCKPNRKRHCEEMGGTFVEKRCKCIKRPMRQTSENEAHQGKFIGSTTFWIYILIGEFVVLLFCFDSILYCKKIGILYRLTKRCRKESSLEINSNNDEQIKEIKVQLNEGCNASQASIPEYYQVSHSSSQS